MDVVATLNRFIDKATEERKYAESSVRGLRAALKIFEPHLNSSEAGSMQAILDNLDNITIDIYTKHKDDNKSTVTLLVYKRRISKLIRDYKQYGKDPAKMAEWNPRRGVAGLKTAASETAVKLSEPIAEFGIQAGSGQQTATSSFYLRPGLSCAISLPADLTADEAERLKQMVDLLGGV